MKKIVLLFLFLTFVSISLAQDRAYMVGVKITSEYEEIYNRHHYIKIVFSENGITFGWYKDLKMKELGFSRLNIGHDVTYNRKLSKTDNNKQYYNHILKSGGKSIEIGTGLKRHNKFVFFDQEGRTINADILYLYVYDLDLNKIVGKYINGDNASELLIEIMSSYTNKEEKNKIFKNIKTNQKAESYTQQRNTEKPKSSSTSPEPKAIHISEFAESYLKGYYKQQNLVFEFDENNELKKETDCLVAWWGTELQLTFTLVNMGLSFSFSADDSRFYEVVGKNGNIEYTLTDALIHEMPEDMKGKIHVSLTAFKGDYMLNVINSENGVVTRSYSTILTDKPIIFKPMNKDTMIEKTGRAGAEDLLNHFFYHGYKAGKVRSREPEF